MRHLRIAFAEPFCANMRHRENGRLCDYYTWVSALLACCAVDAGREGIVACLLVGLVLAQYDAEIPPQHTVKEAPYNVVPCLRNAKHGTTGCYPPSSRPGTRGRSMHKPDSRLPLQTSIEQDSQEPRRFLSAARLIIYDVALTVLLLAALSFVHWFLGLTPVSEDFKALFSSVHQAVWTAAYLLLATKGLYRLWKV